MTTSPDFVLKPITREYSTVTSYLPNKRHLRQTITVIRQNVVMEDPVGETTPLAICSAIQIQYISDKLIYYHLFFGTVRVTFTIRPDDGNFKSIKPVSMDRKQFPFALVQSIHQQSKLIPMSPVPSIASPVRFDGSDVSHLWALNLDDANCAKYFGTWVFLLKDYSSIVPDYFKVIASRKKGLVFVCPDKI